jgi:hypothetical protein
MAEEPTLLEQTIALGKVLMLVSDRDPTGTPSLEAAQAFKSWLDAAGPTSRQPRYFADIAENYVITDNSNDDLFRVFELLHPYIEVPAEEADDDEGDEPPPRTFVGLPIVG